MNFLGTIGIDLERKMILHQEKDANIWKPPEIDHKEVEEVKKFASKEHQVSNSICRIKNYFLDTQV